MHTNNATTRKNEDYQGTVQIAMSSNLYKLTYDDLQTHKVSSKGAKSATGQKSWKCEKNYVIENDSRFGSLICCMLYPSCTVSLNGHLVHLKQKEGKSVTTRRNDITILC